LLLNSFSLSQSLLTLALSSTLVGAGCSASVGDPAPSNSSGQLASKPKGSAVSDNDIPISKRFGTLDDYLAHLELTQGPVDGPWYKKISENMYELQTGNLKLDGPEGTDEKRVFTRQELEKKFGFSK
jgi:hypothetical protein